MNPNTGSPVLQDAHPTIRIEALLALSELPASERAGNAIRDLIILPQNARDRWIPDAVAIAAAKHNPQLALELLRRQHTATDSAYLAGMRTVVQFLTRNLAQKSDAASIVALLEAVPSSNPVIAAGVFEGIAGRPGDGQPFRTEWRVETGGWAQDRPPVLTAQQRAALATAARAVPAFAAEFARVAERWAMPDLFP